MSGDPLFDPITIGTMQLANRIVMAPMTRFFAPGGILTPDVVPYYARRARGGTGLIITEGTVVDHPVAHYSTTVPHFYGEAALARWGEVVDAVHAQGGKIIPQLWHTGLSRLRHKTHNPDVPSISASVITEEDVGAPPLPGGKIRPATRAMEKQDIDAVIAAFARGAADARAIGFDGIAIHGAHGYLLDQFIWAQSNRREDAYGGPIENRIRFAAELVAAVRAAVGPDFPIFFRFSQWKGHDYNARIADTPEELARILQPLAQAGVDVFDASTRRFWQPAFEGSPLNLAGWAKKLTGKRAMTVGSVGLEDPANFTPGAPVSAVAVANLAPLRRMLESGEVDLAGVGRALIANADWADLVRGGRYDDLRAYDPKAVVASLEPA